MPGFGELNRVAILVAAAASAAPGALCGAGSG